MKNSSKKVLWLLGILAAALAAAFLWWTMDRQAVPVIEQAAGNPDVVAVDTFPVTSAAPPEELQPLEISEAALPISEAALSIPEAAQPLAADQIGSAVTVFLGNKNALTLFQLADFPRKFVATIDNLARSHAPPMVWPNNPTEGRFNVQRLDGAMIVSSDNAQRYTPLVMMLEKINAELAVDLYVRMYPVLQQAYEDLGYPNRQFNDRLLVVINHLLATPIAPQAMAVQLTEVKGPIPSVRPWVRYEFADPALEALSSGQKIMLRVGSVNQSRLKATLSALRQEILNRSTAAQ